MGWADGQTDARHPLPLPERDRNTGDLCANKTELVVAKKRRDRHGVRRPLSKGGAGVNIPLLGR